MNTLQIRCRFDKSDIVDATLFSFFGRSPLTAFVMIAGPLILGIAPTAAAVLGAFHLNFNFYLTFYVITYWIMTCFQYKAIFKNHLYNGVHEMYFTDFGIELYTPVQRSRVPASEITGFEEGKKIILILLRNNKSYTIPKRYLTLDEGTAIRNLFSQFYVKRGYFDDSFFKGERLDEAARSGAEQITGEIVMAAADGYLKDTARCRIMNPMIFWSYPNHFFLIGGILSGLGNTAAIIVAVAYTIISVYYSRKKIQNQLKDGLRNFSGCVRIIFYNTYFEEECGNDTFRINYHDITKVRDVSYSVRVHTKHGGVILPRNEEIINKLRINGGKI